MRIAIMQPYFIPYAGYFRLFAASDLVVLYDCVQFPRRGWVHRNQLTDYQGNERWLTLPIAKVPQNTAISGLRFQQNAGPSVQEQMRFFPIFKTENFLNSEYRDALLKLNQDPIHYISMLLKKTCLKLNLPYNVIYSSSLNIPADVKAQDRIIAIANRCQAKEYINLSGGRALYNAATFSRHGMTLKFLDDYQGKNASIVERILLEPLSILRNNILTQSAVFT
ncbi:MAG: hypothetical protein A3E85_04395 [Gammaproteobacteria bacterium RIFCSPHIGHO2_12_FULL_45_12]|nr:MAG: hypothetical protein A3E85_04395 [Gammaproteobacteria bacterium RIFCSPHIGHO2_12_FULL_45_12]